MKVVFFSFILAFNVNKGKADIAASSGKYYALVIKTKNKDA